MSKQSIPCNESQLVVLLDGNEQSDAFRRSAAHLESCRKCQTRLTTLAADQGIWNEVVELLREADVGRDRGHRQLDFLTPPSHPEMLGRVGRYEIESVIGSGGMGVVLKAHDSELNRPVAIKVLAPHLAHNGAARQRFAREGRAAAAVVHEHVMAIHNVESEADNPFLVMQYVLGPSLQSRLDEQGSMDVKTILRIGAQAAAGLAAAHEQGVVHRDVKPANILLENGVERVVLSDFGLARAVDDASVTRQGTLTGTPEYMSPEQAKGEVVDHRSDLFSLGSVLYAMCTGHSPFRGATTLGVLRKIADETPRSIREINPEIPEWLEAIVEKLLEKDASKRYQSAEEIGELLGQWLAHLQAPSTKPQPRTTSLSRRAQSGETDWQFVLRRRWIWIAALSLMFVSVAAASVILVRLGETTVRIEISDPNISVRFGDGEITFENDGQKIRVTPGATNQIVVKNGDAEVRTGSFELRKGQNVVLLISTVNGRIDVRGDNGVVWVPPRNTPQSPPPLIPIRTYKGHTGSVYTLAFSPDGSTLATSGNDRFIRIWDVATGIDKATLRGHTSGVRFLTFNSDGTLLASVSHDKTIGLWDVQTGQRTFTLQSHDGPVSGVAFSPDGKTLATSGDDRTVRLWEVATGSQKTQIQSHNGAVWVVAFSPDGKTLVSGSDDMRIHVWDADGSQQIGGMKGHTGGVRALAFNAKGNLLASGSLDNSIKLWGADSAGKGEWQDLATLKGHTEPVVAVAFSPDGRTLASGSWDDTIKLWDVATRKQIATIQGHTNFIWAVAFSPDGRILASGSRDHTVRLWRVRADETVVASKTHDAAIRLIETKLQGRASTDPGNPGGLRVILSGEHVTDESLQQLSGVMCVSDLLIVPGTSVTAAGLKLLADWKHLRRLTLKDLPVGDDALTHLHGLTGLQELSLVRTQVTDAGLRHLGQLKNLEDLDLTGLPITDAGLQHLKDLSRLKSLSLSGTQVSGSGLEQLSGMKNLERLYLGGTNVTDGGLAHLTALTSLDKLSIEQTQVTDAGVAYLTQLSNLRFVNLLRTKVTDAGVDDLKTRLPACFISR